jgi:predicted dehydrogenase
MCADRREAAILAELAEKPGAPRLYVRHNRRFEANFAYIKNVIADGLLGDVFEISICRTGFSRRDDWQTIKEFGGGQLLNWGPHVIDQALQFAGGGYSSAWYDLRHTVAAGDCEDHVNMSLAGANGVLVNVKISGGMAIGAPDYHVCGTRGSLVISRGTISLRFVDPAQELPAHAANPGTPGSSFGASGTFASAEDIRWVEKTAPCEPDNLSVIWDCLYEDCRNGIPFPITLEESVMVMQVISEAKKELPSSLAALAGRQLSDSPGH